MSYFLLSLQTISGFYAENSYSSFMYIILCIQAHCQTSAALGGRSSYPCRDPRKTAEGLAMAHTTHLDNTRAAG